MPESFPHFAYPNVDVTEHTFLGCGRYCVSQQAPGATYRPVTEEDVHHIQLAHGFVGTLLYDALPDGTTIYERKDHPETDYYGASQHLAYILVLCRRFWGLRLQDIHTDIWCTGAIRRIRQEYILSEVTGFEEKLTAFLDDQNDDQLFIVPAANLDRFSTFVATQPFVNILSVRQLHTIRFSRTPGQKYIVPVHGHELPRLVREVFDCPIPEHLRAPKVPWNHLKTIFADITRHRMSTVQGKYDVDLYQQRQMVKHAFENFLRSETTRCFVLIGKSGIGKSNFLLSLYHEFQQTIHEETRAFLMYDGANVNISPSLTAHITYDVNERLAPFSLSIHDVWQEIACLHEEAEEVTVLLYIDAINEHLHAKTLLQQINELVQKPYPWLKVVCSARSETWDTIKRGVKLAESLYYRHNDGSTAGDDLQPFQCSIRLEPFSYDELPEVYQKYQHRYQVKTSYDQLQHTQREVLRDPLSLWLVSAAYTHNVIPLPLQPHDLIPKYIDALIESKRLEHDNIHFLEHDLVPLLAQNGNYSNMLTVTAIESVGLYNQVFADRAQTDGQRMNQHVLNLLDANILVFQGEGGERYLAFQYERFYEYHVGKYLFHISQSEPDISAFFTNMIQQIATVPFLWGAAKYAITQHLKTRTADEILALCVTEYQPVKEMMVAVLTDFGREYRMKVTTFLEQFLPSSQRLHPVQSVLNRVKQWRSRPDTGLQHAQKIAVEVASHLNLPTLLESASMHHDPAIRSTAVRYSYYLWQRDAQAGRELLQCLARTGVAEKIPNLAALESGFFLALSILFEDVDNHETLSHLQQVARYVIDRFLGIHETAPKHKNWLNVLLKREGLFMLVVNGVLSLYAQMPRNETLGKPSMRDLDVFFRVDENVKKVYRRLIRYINPETSAAIPFEEMERDFFAVLPLRHNLLLDGLTVIALLVQTIPTPHKSLPFLKRLFHEAQTFPPTTFATDKWNMPIHIVIGVINNLLDLDPTLDEVFKFHVHTINVCQEYSVTEPSKAYPNVDRYTSTAQNVAQYLYHQFRRTGNVKTTWMQSRIDTALEHHSLPFFETLIGQELHIVGIQKRTPQAALDTIALFFNRRTPEIEQLLLAFLIRLRVYYPNEVDLFLEECKAPEHFRLLVRTSESDEAPGELLWMKIGYVFWDQMLSASPMLQQRFIRALEKAVECKSAREWFHYLFYEFVNLVYGEEILSHSTKTP